MTPEDLRGPRIPRLPGEPVDAYIDRILDTLGVVPPKPADYPPLQFTLFGAELFPEVAMPPSASPFRPPEQQRFER